MSQMIPENYADLLEKPAFGNLGTLMKDGSPQVTPVWLDYDGKFVRINSAKGRVKDKIYGGILAFRLRYRIRKCLSLSEIRGKVVEITEKGADDHINKLSQKYLGNQFTLSGSRAKCA